MTRFSSASGYVGGFPNLPKCVPSLFFLVFINKGRGRNYSLGVSFSSFLFNVMLGGLNYFKRAWPLPPPSKKWSFQQFVCYVGFVILGCDSTEPRSDRGQTVAMTRMFDEKISTLGVPDTPVFSAFTDCIALRRNF